MKRIRGWVYVITNKSVPGLVKVGFSTKDPALRAEELGNTGVPDKYELRFDILVFQPREIEQRVHGALADLRVRKEWFRCTVNHAIGTIIGIAGSDALLENWEGSLLSEASAAQLQLLHGESDSGSGKNDARIALNVSRRKVGRVTQTIAVKAACPKCETRFSVTLTRGESSACCPECFSAVSLSGSWYK